MTDELSLAAPIDVRELRQTFGAFATGVTVVTTRTPEGIPQGATVTSFTAISLEPPLAQVTLPRSTRAAQYLNSAPFAINILSVAQRDVALHFALGDVMEGDPDWVLDGDVPVLCGNAGTLKCRPWNIYDGGDHLIVVGEVVSLEHDVEVEPLLFFGGKLLSIGETVDRTLWDHCPDGPEAGWFAGSPAFIALPPLASPSFELHDASLLMAKKESQ